MQSADLIAPAAAHANIHRGRLAEGVWLALALVSASVHIAGCIFLYRDIQRACTLLPPDCAAQGLLTVENVRRLTLLGWSVDYYSLWLLAAFSVIAGLYFVVGALIFAYRSHNRNAWFTSLYLVLYAGIGRAPVIQALTRGIPELGWPIEILSFLNSVLSIFFLLTFPNGRFLPRWTLLFGLWGIAQFPAHFLPDSPLNINYWPGWLIVLALASFYGSLLGIQIYRYRYILTRSERQQTKWVFFGVTLTMIGIIVQLPFFLLNPQPVVVFSSLTFVQYAIITGALSVFPLSIGVAVLRSNLFDIDLLINRTLVYGSLTALVVAGYVLLVTAFSAAFSAIFRATDNLLPSLMATGLIAVLFQPLRYQLQRGVNRLMYGERDEPYAVLARLGQRLEAAFEPSAVLPSIVETVAKTLNLPYVAIATVEHGELTVRSEWRTPDASAELQASTLNAPLITMPLIHHHEQLGEMRVCPRRGETTLAEADRRLLADLVQQASAAVHGVRLMNDLRDLTTDLQHSRERLVSAREEERRRLRRDLHDDLAPMLAGLALTADTVADLIPTDPAKATALANDLNHSLRAAVSAIRRLVYDLRPPTLDELGLVAAIRERAAQFTHAADGLRVTVEADELPPLPAAVEVAAYRIAQEALMNVARHAQAKACHIRLALDDDGLQLEITDDGLGLTETHTPGVGLPSMQERSAELGGACVIERGLNGGTCVQVSLPISKAGTYEPTPDSDR